MTIKIRNTLKPSLLSSSRLLPLALLTLSCSALACDDLLFTDVDPLEIPEVLRVPPVREKQIALQALLDGLLSSTYITEDDCERRGSITICERFGGSVELEGAVDQEVGELDLLGVEVEQLSQVLSLKRIELRDVRAYVYVSDRRISAPNSCKIPARINGRGSIHARRASIESKDGERVTISVGGVYRGAFNVTFERNPLDTYQIDLEAPGFYYRRDMIPLKVELPTESGSPREVSVVQISVIHSGRLSLNDQKYSYQDVFVESLDSEQFWGERCNTPD